MREGTGKPLLGVGGWAWAEGRRKGEEKEGSVGRVGNKRKEDWEDKEGGNVGRGRKLLRERKEGRRRREGRSEGK